MFVAKVPELVGVKVRGGVELLVPGHCEGRF
jgi:hypothetical protein